MLVFSLTCEKSNSRTDENCIFLPIFVRKKDYVCRTRFECPAARTAGRPNGRTARLTARTARLTARTARLTAPDGGAGARRLRPLSLTKPKIMTHLRLQVWGIQGLPIYQIGGEYIILVGFVRESVILMTSRFTEFSKSVRKVFLVARRIVTNENYCLFFLTNIGRNMQFSNAMEKSN